MTCALDGGIELRFLRSNIRIEPYELNLRSKSRNYMHGQIVCARDGARSVKESAFEAEPAVLEFGGNVSHRFYIDKDDIEFFFNYDDQPRARIEIHDARKVLERGSVERNYTKTSLKNVIDDILNDDADDPNGVIQEVRFSDDEIKEDIRVTGQELFDFLPGIWSFNNPLENWLTKQFESIDDNPAEIFSGFEFNDITPLQAMERVMKEFEYKWWVDHDGTLWIGQDGTFGNVVATIAEGDEVAIERYDVVESSTKTNRVVATSDIPSTVREEEIGAAVPSDIKTRLKSVAVASAPSLEGDSEQLSSKKVLSQGQLKRAASRYLYERVMDDVNGSITINGMASNNKAAIARLQPGDHFFVNQNVEEKCAPGTVTGHFIVKSVSHRATPMQGWRITVNLSQVVPHDELQVQSFYYDPTTDTRYDDVGEVTTEESEFDIPIGRYNP